jgi:octaprenyl-diphosphate synthase
LDLIKEIHHHLVDDLNKVNQVIISSLSVEEELVQIIGNHLAKSGGKRIRPILTLISAKMFGYTGDNSINLAAAIEFIHMATLLHDDVVDGSKMRRFLPSANVTWGSKASILVGDFLFSQSFKLIVSTKSLSSLEVLSRASAIIAEGEVSQLVKLEEKKILSQEEYFKIINSKTAELFASACETGAIISNQSDEYCQNLNSFGAILGKIFQISDDTLDYFSHSNKIGKNTGSDFKEGKVTLPLIFLYKKLSPSHKEKVRHLIASESRSDDYFIWIQEQMIKNDIPEEISLFLNQLKILAISSLDQITIENQYKNYLKLLVDFAITRSY